MNAKRGLLGWMGIGAMLLVACGRTSLYVPRPMVVCDGDVCFSSNDGGSDARNDGTSLDAVDDTVPDEWVPPDVPDARIPRCGDRILDPGESCDDGNNANGDGCDARCRWEARCGDGRVDIGEICDDGNNRSGDGCRSDCLSNERCGNGIVDYGVGEVCDGTPNCAADCRSISTCGNNTVETGEQCDDGNTARWDGCSSECLREQGIGFEAFFISPDNGRTGCDFSGDGRPDNAFGHALGASAGILNTAISGGISNGQVLLQLSFVGLADPLGVNAPNLRIGWTVGADGDAISTNNRDPGNPQRVRSRSLNTFGLPTANYQGSIVNAFASGGPEDILLDLPGPMGTPFRFHVTRSHVSGTVLNDATRIVRFGTRLDRINDGTLCGAIPMVDLAALPNFFELIANFMGGGGPPQSTFLDAIVGGYTVMVPLFGSFSVGPQQPDVDLDGDGLERIEATPGNRTTLPAITACIDGNGARIVGAMCVFDPRIADGFSSAFQMYGPWITFVGVQ